MWCQQLYCRMYALQLHCGLQCLRDVTTVRKLLTYAYRIVPSATKGCTTCGSDTMQRVGIVSTSIHFFTFKKQRCTVEYSQVYHRCTFKVNLQTCAPNTSNSTCLCKFISSCVFCTYRALAQWQGYTNNSLDNGLDCQSSPRIVLLNLVLALSVGTMQPFGFLPGKSKR